MLFLFTTYVQATLWTTVDVRLTERRKEAEYINSISKAEACVYCGTVLFVAEGGFHSEGINVAYCLLSQAFSVIVFI